MTKEFKDSIRMALVILEQIAKRSSDRSSQALASGAAADLRAHCPSEIIEELPQ